MRHHQWPRCKHPNEPLPHPDGAWVHLPVLKSYARMTRLILLRPGEKPPKGAMPGGKKWMKTSEVYRVATESDWKAVGAINHIFPTAKPGDDLSEFTVCWLVPVER